ncbi:MAG TPA: hypothetical protein DD412_00200 [Holosporales bacterium]|nr:hypothetical protein [Holosporales bacterium]
MFDWFSRQLGGVYWALIYSALLASLCYGGYWAWHKPSVRAVVVEQARAVGIASQPSVKEYSIERIKSLPKLTVQRTKQGGSYMLRRLIDAVTEPIILLFMGIIFWALYKIYVKQDRIQIVLPTTPIN